MYHHDHHLHHHHHHHRHLYIQLKQATRDSAAEISMLQDQLDHSKAQIEALRASVEEKGVGYNLLLEELKRVRHDKEDTVGRMERSVNEDIRSLQQEIMNLQQEILDLRQKLAKETK